MDFSRVRPYRWLLAGWGGLALLYAKPLWDLVGLARGADLHSHLPMIPFVCGYLVFVDRERLPEGPSRPAWGWGGLLFVAAFVALAVYLVRLGAGVELPPEDVLWPGILSLVLLCWGWLVVAGGRDVVRSMGFAAAFLIFMVPLSTGFAHWLETVLQHASAEVAYRFIAWTGTSIFRVGTVFHMPGLVIEVAPECSGIRSSLVLFIGALLAAHLLLDQRWKKILLVVLVIPLGILRNGFRILTISWLTIHVDERVIDSPLHHRGGPIFFVLSLIVLFAILLLLRRIGRKKKPAGGDAEDVAVTGDPGTEHDPERG